MGGGRAGTAAALGEEEPGSRAGCPAALKPPPDLLPGRCRQCSSTLLPGAYRSGPEEGTFVCAEHCARLGPGGRLGAKPGPPLQPKQQQLAEEVKDVDGGGAGASAPAGAEVGVPKASPEARPQIATKPRLPSKPQELGSSPAGRPTPAPRKAPESPALTPPTPRPRSSLQHENSAEQGGSSGLVNGERGSSGSWALAGVRLVFQCTCVCVGSFRVSTFSGPCSVPHARGACSEPSPELGPGDRSCSGLVVPSRLCQSQRGDKHRRRDFRRTWESLKIGEAEALVGFM